MASPLAYIEGKYEILEKLSEGGMGAIYKVRHRLLDEIRVIKVMQPQHERDEGLKARFTREARMAVKLRHPNIAQMYDFAVDDAGNAFIVMEFIDGITLQEMLERIGPPSMGLVLELALQSLDAVGYLHQKGIIHRDIAPDNIMVTRDEAGRPHAKLIDLGIAKVLKGESGLTVTGMFVGKLRYSSPEQFRTEAAGVALDERSDIYSFGVVLYELLTGKHPVQGTSPQALIAGHLVNPPADFAQTDPHGRVPEELRAAVLRAMAKRPEERFQSTADFSAILRSLAPRYPISQADLDRALDLPVMPTQRIVIPRPGSTQDRIDRQFRAVPTPVPGTAPARPTRSVAGPTVSGEVNTRHHVEALLAGAGKLLDAGHPDEARLQLLSLLRLDPGHAQAVELLARVEIAAGRSVATAQRIAAMAPSIAVVERCLDAGDVATARSALTEVEGAFGGAPELASLQERIVAAEAALAGSSAPATEMGETVVAVPPSEESARAISEAVASVSALLDGGQLESALQKLEAAEARLGRSTALVRLRQRVDEALRSSREAKLGVLIEEARAFAAEGRFQESLDRLRRAGTIAPEAAEVKKLLADVERAAAGPPTKPSAPPPPPPSTAPATPPPPASASPPTAVPATPPPSAGAARRSVWPLFAAAGVVVLAVVGFLVLRVGLRRAVPTPTPLPTVGVPTVIPVESPVPVEALRKLSAAEAALGAADAAGVRSALDALTPDDEKALSTGDIERLAKVREGLASLTASGAVQDLGRALASGNLDVLARAVAGVSANPALAAHDPKVAGELKTARQALEIAAAMNKAVRENRHLDVVSQARSLLAIVPKASRAIEARDAAAAAIEAESDAQATGGQLDAAAQTLEGLRNVWPERPGLGGKIEAIASRRQSEQRFAAALAAAAQAEQEKRPDRGLEALASVAPSGRWEADFKAARERLQKQLAQLDNVPPVVQLRPGGKLEYEKGKPGLIALVISDDFGVHEIKAFGRPDGGGAFAPLPVRSLGGKDYVIDVDPAFHRNEDVFFYVTAKDLSGHTTSLGSPQDPLKLKRKRWLF